MRAPTTSVVVAAAVVLLAATAIPSIAQDEVEPEASLAPVVEEDPGLERPSVGVPLEGTIRDDGIIVFSDTDYCSYLLSEIWGDRELTFRSLIDRSKQQRKAKNAAFQPFSDEATIARCAEVVDAFRRPTTEADTLPGWARKSAVVPSALQAFLPAAIGTDPLAKPADIGDGARTLGFGDTTSAPFTLWGGAYYVELRAGACDAWSGSIRSVSDPSLEAGVVDGTTYVYGIPTGNYFWDVTAPDCDWSVDLVVFEIGPDPSPSPTPKTVVPALIGTDWIIGEENPEFLPIEVAADVLREAGLEVHFCQIVRERHISQGRVAFQEPPPGTLVEPGSSIRVHVTWQGNCDSMPMAEGGQIFA